MDENSDRKPLPAVMNAAELLDMYFLDIRSHLLEAAAALDRIARAPGGKEAMSDPRCKKLVHALDILKEPGTDRAHGFLEFFSEPS